MSSILLEDGAVDSIKGAGGCVSNESAGAVFLTLFFFTDAADISAAPFISIALEDIQWKVRL